MQTKVRSLDREARSKAAEHPIKPRDIELIQLFNEVFLGQDHGLRIPITASCIVRFLQSRNEWHTSFKLQEVDENFSRMMPLDFDWFVERNYLARQEDGYLVTNGFIDACQLAPLADAA